MKWFKKREIIAYMLLRQNFGDKEFTLFEGIELLSPYFSKRVAKNIVIYLKKRGLLVCKGNNLKVEDLYLYLQEKLLPEYLNRRITLRQKSQ
ncbi:hypothetical protein HS7_17800 [Sulfolobales archaeon HS-7]|nr:hypothetical protein HS7_17800 [Sulfolobales archaeon HS-7]